MEVKMKKVTLILFFLLVYSMIYSCYENKIGSLIDLLDLSWKGRDGIAYFLSHKAIIQLSLISPEETLPWLERNKEISSELFSNWEQTVFQDHSGEEIKKPKKCFQELKERIRKRILKTQFKDEKLKNFKLIFLIELDKVKIN
jgi:hypothetical protein